MRGASAGGFTGLVALTRSTVFSAGTSLYGVADLAPLTRTTHKFERRYIGTLVGAEGADAPVLAERSPLHHIDDIHAPLLLLQGSEDPIVPADQATTMYNAVRAKGLPVALEVFHGEGHGLRLASNIHRALRAELNFYSQVWGLELPEEDSIAMHVENL